MLEFHPLANLFPLIEGAEFEALVADVRENGLHDPIVIHEDKILDGRNRLRACRAARVEPRFDAFVGKDALSFVISKNLARRHLRESQRALIGARIANELQGRRKASKTSNRITQSEAAQLLNVSVRSIRNAKTVAAKGVPDLVSLVEAGRLSIFAAGRVAELDGHEQLRIVRQGSSAAVRYARGGRSSAPSPDRGEYAHLWKIAETFNSALERHDLAGARAAALAFVGQVDTKRGASA